MDSAHHESGHKGNGGLLDPHDLATNSQGPTSTLSKYPI